MIAEPKIRQILLRHFPEADVQVIPTLREGLGYIRVTVPPAEGSPGYAGDVIVFNYDAKNRTVSYTFKNRHSRNCCEAAHRNLLAELTRE